MIGSSSFSLPAVDALRKSLENGTLKAARIEVANATPQLQAQLDASFLDSQKATAEMTAHYRANPSWATFDPSSNKVELPDVQSLGKSDATHIANGLQYLLQIGRLEGKTLSAKNGDLATDSLAQYQDWLQARIGVNTQA